MANCTCNSGFTGNGTICVPIDPCHNVVCPSNASCLAGEFLLDIEMAYTTINLPFLKALQVAPLNVYVMLVSLEKETAVF